MWWGEERKDAVSMMQFEMPMIVMSDTSGAGVGELWVLRYLLE